MSQAFDSDTIARLGWRQGAIVGTDVAARAREQAPSTIEVHSADLLIVTSHDCDVLNPSIEKEPFVEVLAARRVDAVGRMQMSGRNPRALQFAVADGDRLIPVSCSAHRRWAVSRELLLEGKPQLRLPHRERRLVAEWLAKRYIRAAFPSAFDQRWRSNLRGWQKLLQRWSEWVQGVYLRLNSLVELADTEPYQCHLLMAVPHLRTSDEDWPRRRRAIEEDVEKFWGQFEPAIECAGVDVLSTDEITLADIEQYQRFDADWVSHEDETEMPPMAVGAA